MRVGENVRSDVQGIGAAFYLGLTLSRPPMTRRQQNTHTMHAAVLHLLDEQQATWADHRPVGEAVDALREAHERVAALDRERAALTTPGLTDDKAEQRDAMEAATLRLVRAVRPYARVTANRALEAEVDVSARELDRASDAVAVGWAERVHAATEPHLAALAGYRVAASDVAALRAAIDVFTPLGAARDTVGGQREARTGALPESLDAARAAVALLDDLVPGLDDAMLTAEYARVRRTDDR